MKLKHLYIREIVKKHNQVFLVVGSNEYLINALPKKVVKSLIKRYKDNEVKSFYQESKVMLGGTYWEHYCNVFKITISL